MCCKSSSSAAIVVGFLLIDDQNQLIYLNGNARFRDILYAKQMQMSNNNDVAIELAAPTTSSSSSSSASGSASTLNSHRHFDMHLLNQYFLPLVILYRAKLQFDTDAYCSIVSDYLTWCFRLLHNSYLLITIQSSMHIDESNRSTSDILSIISFYFGPLLPFLSSSSSTSIDSFTKYAKRQMHSTLSSTFSCEQFESIDDMRSKCRCINANLFTNASSTLKSIGDELQLFVGVSTCLLFADDDVISIYCSDRNRLPTIDDLSIVIRGRHRRKHRVHVDYIWLRDDDDDESVRRLHNIYR